MAKKEKLKRLTFNSTRAVTVVKDKDGKVIPEVRSQKTEDRDQTTEKK